MTLMCVVYSQEIKITEGINTNIHDYRHICQKTNQKDYGNEFLTHKRLEQHIHKVWKLNHRISILEIQMKPQYIYTQNGKGKITISKKEEKYTSTLKGTKLKILKKTQKCILKIVNVYAPHSEITNKNPEITINIYNDLNNLLNQINNKSSIVLVAGNFNEKTDIDKCLGNFSDRRRNQNGQYLIHLCTNYDLSITSTCFRHKEKRLITWEQIRIVQGKLQELNKTIDYI